MRRGIQQVLSTAGAGARHCDPGELLKKGTKFTLAREFSREDLVKFADLSLDTNPIHTQPSQAHAAGFQACVVHGMLTSSLFPAIIGSNFPGAIYLSQSLKFRNPAFADDKLVAEVTVVEAVRLKQEQFKVTFATTCFKENSSASDLIVVDGTAEALLRF